MRVERRSPTTWLTVWVNQQWEEPMPEAKPYDIPKRLVWEAYQRVKANRGAAGVDGESVAAFEQDLKGNLYKGLESHVVGLVLSATRTPRRG
jgi:hypothetical protein